MKKIFLVCNAHLDPVWLWNWQEGATAAIATFRTAADFCEQYEGFVFCHNEALLYEWVKEYDPELFGRIQTLVAAGKWCIIGGWFLQPDCNLPSGESILRQIIVGQKYFEKYFGVRPRVAVNFDAFGHGRGLVQILKQCGYTGYLFMRPEKERMDLPARNFRWTGFDGSQILAHRLDRSYRSMMGKALEDINQWCSAEQEEEISLFTWGIGNHGGGPSHIDLQQLNHWMETHCVFSPSHSTPEAFFQALEAEKTEYPTFAGDLRPVFVGCYTSQAKLKRLHRQLESQLCATEKLLAGVAAQGLVKYPGVELSEAQRDLLFCEFHDILPGTSIQEGEHASIATLNHGLDILGKLQMKGVMALLSGQEKARPEETPVFIYNPHPYPITGVFSFELMPADQNWDQRVRNTVVVSQNGEAVVSQEEKTVVNMNLDWRKRVSIHTTLKPSSLNRFDCAFKLLPVENNEEIIFPQSDIVFDNGDMQVTINKVTGLVDRYVVQGIDYLKENAFQLTVFEDNPDPWHMGSHSYGKTLGGFRLAEDKPVRRYSDGAPITASALRIVEDGPVRMIVEAEFVWHRSRVTQSYILPRKGTAFEVTQHVLWNEEDMMLKLEVPTTIHGSYLGQGMFGSGQLPQDGMEAVSQKWCGMFGSENALTIINDGTYGSHCDGTTVCLSLLRSPAYAAHPIDDRKLVHEERFIPRMDQGEHNLRFSICGGGTEDRKRTVDFEAQVFNEVPFVFSAFPSGNGTMPKQAILLSDPSVLLSAMYYDEGEDAYFVRLWNSLEQHNCVTVELPFWGITKKLNLDAFQLKTYCIRSNGELQERNPV